MIIYNLTAEDWTSVGGPMGQVETPIILDELFHELDAAKTFALKDYQKREKDKKATFKFRKERRGWTSGDLRYISYSIYPVKVR